MANTIKPKRSNTASKVPNTSELVSGELGVNMADKKIYINNGTSIVQVGAGLLSALGDVVITTPASGQSLSYNGTNWVNSNAGAGDVVGAASSTDNALVRFDGTTGKVIQNSVVTLDDTGNESGLLSEQYNTSTTPPAIVAGLEAWDSGNGTLELGLLGGNVSYKYGQQEFARVYNGSASTMTKGQIVYIIGAQGNRIDVRLALATADGTSAGTIGMVVDSIAAGAEGWVQTAGTVYKLNTSTLTAGQTIYLSPTTAGAYTTTKPTAPNHLVVLGFVERISATVGSIYLKIDNGYELDELHNVLITSPTSGNTLIYDAVAGVWENANITAGTGISVTNGAGSITIAATNAGTVTSVTGTSPISSTGGATPVISLDNTSVTAGSYTYASITVDAKGRLTAASSGASPSAFPAGTAMLFVQTSAPTGWTKSTTHDNKALRIVSGTAGSGGSVAFTTAFASQTPTGSISVTVGAGTLAVGAGTFAVGATTLATTQIPSHGHGNKLGSPPTSSYGAGGSYWYPYILYSPNNGGTETNAATLVMTGGGNSHTHGLTGSPSLSGSPSVTSSSFTGTAINLAVQYVDVIIATKD